MKTTLSIFAVVVSVVYAAAAAYDATVPYSNDHEVYEFVYGEPVDE